MVEMTICHRCYPVKLSTDQPYQISFGKNIPFPLHLQRKQNLRRERRRSLLLLSTMSIEGQIQALEQKILTLIESEPDIFLVEIRITPSNNVKLFLDSDTGMSLDKLIGYNRKLYSDLEENSFFPGGDFSLEVSSPGLDEPLKLRRQYLKNIGRGVEVTRIDGVKIEGKLLEVGEKDIEVEEEKGKGKKKNWCNTPYHLIK